jgi:hypothetical protein
LFSSLPASQVKRDEGFIHHDLLEVVAVRVTTFRLNRPQDGVDDGALGETLVTLQVDIRQPAPELAKLLVEWLLCDNRAADLHGVPGHHPDRRDGCIF